jgi:hypothetical protein
MFETPWLILPGLLLLLLPLDWLLVGEVRLGQMEQMFQSARRRKVSGWNALVLIGDSLRAGLGAWCMFRGAGIWAEGREWARPELVVPGVLALGLLAGMVAQLYTRRDSEALLAPLGYSAGLIAALANPMAAVLGLIMAVAMVMGLRNWSAFFVTAALGVGGLGLAFADHDRVTPVILGVVVFVPAIAGMLTNRHLMMPGR